MTGVSLAAQLEHDGVPQSILIRATEEGRFGFLASDCDEDRITAEMLRGLSGRYLICVATHRGPGRVASANPLRRWGRFAFIHGSGPSKGDYAFIAGLVDRHQRVVLIETIPPLVPTWMAFLQRSMPSVGVMGRTALR